MLYFLGLDTSNYTTSCALYDPRGTITEQRRPLPVEKGQRGLRQNDAVFLHNAALPKLLSSLLPGPTGDILAVGASDRPRLEEGSYMPCFTVGAGYGQAIACSLGVPYYAFSHQQGHIAAALFSAGALGLLSERFLAFHVSGGTTELVIVSPRGRDFQTEPVGRTLDISAGQLIDRTGVRMGLSFPCGEKMEKLAQNAEPARRPSVCVKDGDCCLSGVENLAEGLVKGGANAGGVAAFVIMSVIGALDGMLSHALSRFGDLPVLMTGGVAACAALREHFAGRYGAICASPKYAGDNAAGAAILACRAHGAAF